MNTVDAHRAAPVWQLVVCFVLALLLTYCGMVLRAPTNEPGRNSDENIVVGMHTAMAKNGNLNTDWNSAAPAFAREYGGYHFNMSGYILASYFLTPTPTDGPQVYTLRNLNVYLFAATLIVFIGICACIGLAWWPSLIGMAVLALSPGLVHDAEMARPETFLTLLVAFFALGLVMSRRMPLVGLLLASVVLGISAATKFTCVLFALPLAYAVLIAPRDKVPVLIYCALAAVGGFFAAAPYVAVDLRGFLDGLIALRLQYSSDHIPHADAAHPWSMLAQLTFFGKLYGVVFLSPLLLLGACRPLLRRLPDHGGLVLALAALFVIFFVNLGIHKVFFERNLHPFIVILALCTAVACHLLLRAGWQCIAALVCVMPLVYWTHIVLQVQQPAYLAGIYHQRVALLAPFPQLALEDSALLSEVASCGLIRQTDYSDRLSRRLREAYMAHGYQLLGAHISKFDGLPTSTLHTFLDPGLYYWYKPCSN